MDIVRKHFPQVNKVVDANDSIIVSVAKEDSVSGRKNDPKQCALAKACVRGGADGAIINIGFSYLIKGEVATRYKTSVGVGREITSFDRHQDFAVGRDYVLGKVSPGNRLGYHKGGPSGKPPHKFKKPMPIVHKHRTSRIRVSTMK